MTAVDTGRRTHAGLTSASVVVPALPPRCVPRPRLVDALTEASGHSLTLIAAAPGSGKTVLLTEWASMQPSPPAWVSLGRSDNDPARFWPLVVEAFRVAGLVASAGEFEELSSASIDDNMRVVEPYLNPLLGDDARPVHLILDDAHILTDPMVLAGLDSLIRGPRPRLRLILAARMDPLLPLHRYRLAGQMSELRARDLAMTDEESHALLLAHDVALSPREFNVLTARTEGWAAGLRLSAMSMEGAEHPEEFVTEFALDQGSVGEYLMNEVLGRQPDPVRRLLIETSFLSEVNAELAEAVTGFRGAGDTLTELSRTNSFVLPLDRASRQFRYHQLFRETLRYLLGREPLQRRRELFDRASQWYHERGRFEEALRLAADGRDWPHAAAMLVHGGFAQAFINHADLSFVHAGDLGPGAGADSAELWLARAALLAAAGRPIAAQRELDGARQAHGAPQDSDQSHTIALIELVIARSQHRVRDLESIVSAVIAQSGDDEALAALSAAALLEQGCAQFWSGDHDNTERLLTDAVEGASRAGDIALELRCVSQLALLQSHWGRFRSSDECEVRANVLLAQNPELAAPTSLQLALSIRAFFAADFEASFESLRDAEATLSHELDADLRGAVPILRGLLLASIGQVGPARSALAPGPEPLSAMSEDFRVTTLADIETVLGRPNAALKQLRAHTSPPSPATSLAVSRAHLALGDLCNAEDALRPILAGGESNAPRNLVVEALITQAQAAAAADQGDRAVDSLLRARELAEGEIVHPFLRVADDLRGLVARHPSLAVLWAGIAPRPRSGPGPGPGPGPGELATVAAYPPSPPLPEPLTDRERTVLRWLSTTMTTRDIADEMCLSVNTVKTHIAAIYRKLAAARRRDAVLRARVLELL